MSLRKFMHPRNKYKQVTDFNQLAVLYPEFRKIAITNLAGKVRIDFKNEESLRVLTEVLLKHDFGLVVKIPPNKLVPTLPLRLNYILWIEDLMKYASFPEMEEVTGVDIGTGAVGIYPLLFAKIYGSHMIGTEIDETSVQTAVQQIQNNNLQHLITVLKVSGETVLKDVIENDSYHFVMCNPPFFEKEGQSRKAMKRLPPRNAPTGNEGELTIQGGERTFVTKMIDESSELREKTQIYTTMFGQKSNLLFLIKLLKKRGIENSTWTEFCQGHTKRWGLAWSFLKKDVIDLTKAPVIRKSQDYVQKLLRVQRPTEIIFPMQDKYPSIGHVIDFLEEQLEKLNIRIEELNSPIDCFEGWACKLIAEKNTWSHARRKRRLEQRQMQQSCIQQSTNAGEVNSTTGIPVEEQNFKNEVECIEEQDTAQTSTEHTEAKQPFLVCNFFVELVEREEIPENDEFKISMVLEEGSGGKNALESFRQYLINILNVRGYFQKPRRCEPSKKKRKRLKKIIDVVGGVNVGGEEARSENSSAENSVESS